MSGLQLLHTFTCLVLVGASVFWRVRHGRQANAHRFLYPFILAVGTTAILLLGSYAVEIFVANYSGAIYSVKFRFAGPYWWAYSGAVILPFVPIAGILPPIGRKPLLMGFLGGLALIPAAFVLITE